MVSIRSHLAKGRVESLLQTLGFFPLTNTNSQRQSVQWVGRRCCAAGYDGRAAARPYLPSSILAACTIAALCLAAMVVRADERDVQFNRWFAAQTNLQSWSADFTQTRSLKVLSQPLVATGKVWVTAPGLFRWELGQPAQTIVLRQPNQLLIIYPRLKRAEKYSLEGVPPGPLKDALALMDASLPRDRASMEERFRLLSATATNSILQMTLQPKSVSARKFISEILIGFHTNDFSIAVTELKFADGSGLRNDFTNTVLNQPIDHALFEEKLPPDFTVVEPLRQ